MKHRKQTRIVATVMVLCMMLSLFPVTALGLQSQDTDLNKGSDIPGTGYHITSLKNHSIAPDISERVIVTNNDAGNSQTVANVMEVNTAGGRAKIVAGYGNRNPKEEGWTLKTTTDQAHVYEKETGLNVVGGVNASWFNINTGEPSGYLVMNGVVHHDNSARAFVAAFDDGSVNVFREGTTLAQAEADQSAKQGKTVKIVEAVDALVAMVWDGEVVSSESGNGGYYPRTCVGVKADGTVVLFQADGTMAPRSVGYTAEEEARMMVALGCVAAIQLDEGGSSTYISQREGEKDLSMRNVPAGGSERVVSGTILVVSTVAASGEFDHAAVTPDGEYYTPNSTVELTASAMDYSGAPAKSLPSDAVFTVSDAAMGTVSETAVNGSGASATFVSSGKTGDVTVSLVSGGRTVGTATLHIQNPDKLAFTSGEVNLNYSESSDLGFKATYQSETVHLKDGDIDWSISDTSAGSFAGNVFTVTDNVKYSGSPTVTAKRGDLSATVTVNIGMEPTMILDGGDEDPWDYSTIGTTVENFDGMASDAVATYHYGGRGGVVKGSVVSDTDEEFADIVRFGHNAIKLEYDWTGLAGTDGACLGLGDNLAIDGTPTALGVWVYIPEGVPVPWLRAQIATSTNGGASWTNAYVNFSNGSAAAGEGLKAGWQYLEADLTQYAGALIRVNSGMLFRAMVTTSGIGWYTTDGVKLDKSDLKGYILLDNFCVVYGANNQDVTAPTVNSIQLVNNDGTKTELEDGMTLRSGDLRFFVTYDDNEETDPFAMGVESAYFYFDGTYRGSYDKDILGSTSALMHFSEGLHSITFYLKDGYGNVTRETRYFTVDADDAKLPGVSLDIQGSPMVGKPWVMELNSSDPASITSLSANISLTRKYPAAVTFPDGVTGTYDYDAAKGMVSVSITGIDHDVYTAGALAMVSVDIPTSVVEGSSINVRVAKGSYGCKQTEGMSIGEVNQYAAGFSTPVENYPVEAVYRITADTAVVGGTAAATVTVIQDGKAAAGVNVYANDELLGVTDEKGQIDISNLTATQGSVNLRAADAEGNCSYQITLFSYDAVGDESGAPYNVIYNVAPSADGKTITWMSNPTHSAAQAIVQISANADMSEATDVEGVSRLISYSSSKQINRVNAVSLTGLAAGSTYYFRVGDGSVWSEVRSFTVPAIGAETRFFLLADIQEEAALEGMGRIAQHLNGQYHFGVQLGDAVDNVRYYNQWQDALDLFTLEGVRDTDMIHVIGNHEADDSGNGSIAAKSVFGVPAAWYSVERGDVYIAVLNHTSDKDSLQQFAQWLVEDAAKSNCTWKVVVTHVPAYYTNPVGGGETYIQYLPQACDAAGIDFYFAGNDHSYARTAPLTAGQVNENGTVYYICGSTGGKSYSIVDNPDFHFEKATLDFDSVYVDVTADRYQATVTAYNIAEDGSRTVLDQYTKRNVPICENDEHTYVYDSDTDILSCEKCGYKVGAKESSYPGWAQDLKTGRSRYFIGGVSATGVLALVEGVYSFDQDGLAYEGVYEIHGEQCEFANGQFVRCTTADVLDAGLCGQTAVYVLYRDGTMVVDGTGAMDDYESRGVTPIRQHNTQIKRLVIGKDITYIGKFNFNWCGNLQSVTFEEGTKLERIGWGAFGYSSLPEITIPDTVTQIDGYAFYFCEALTKVTISENSKLAELGNYVFKADKKITSLYIPDGVTKIGTDIFRDAHDNVTLSVAANSYAQSYAEKYGLAYTARPVPVQAVASGSCGETASWQLTNEGTLYINGSGAMSDNDPNHAPWEKNKQRIKHVVIGKDITYIGKFNFFRCGKLQSVTFEEGTKLERIGWGAFGYSSLPEIAIPDSVTQIDGYAFYFCEDLTKVTISENSKLAELGNYVFKADKKITSLYIPDGVTKIGTDIFRDAHDNVTLSVAANSYAQSYAEKYGLAYTARPVPVQAVASGSCGETASWQLTNEGILYINGSGAMRDNDPNHAPWEACKQQIRQVVIGKDITYIGKFNFFRCGKLQSVTFEEGTKLERIGWGAFGYSSLPEIAIPDTVTQIDGYAFYFCENLTKVTISESSKLAVLGNYVFKADKKITSLYIPDGVTKIGTDIFRDAHDNVTLSVAANSYAQSYAEKYGLAYTARPVPVQAVASGSCGETASWQLTNEGILYINGSGAMSDNDPNHAPWEACKQQIRQVVIGKDITYIGKFNFYWCGKLQSVTFEEGTKLERIGWGAFGYSSLPEITIPDTVTQIDGYAFYFCEALTKVTISENSKLAELGNYVFKADKKITSLYIPDGVTKIGTDIFRDAHDNVTLSVAANSYAQSYAEKYGIAYVLRETFSEDAQRVMAVSAANSCGDDLTWTLENSVLTISGNGEMDSYAPDAPAPWAAFSGEIERVIIGKGVEKIGAYAFSGLEKLASVSFEEGSQLAVIEEYAFADCKELRELALPDGLEKLGEAAFANCEKLSKLALPESVVAFEIITIQPETPAAGISRRPVGVFDGCDLNVLVLVVARDCAAQKYAAENGIAVRYAECDRGAAGAAK